MLKSNVSHACIHTKIKLIVRGISPLTIPENSKFNRFSGNLQFSQWSIQNLLKLMVKWNEMVKLLTISVKENIKIRYYLNRYFDLPWRNIVASNWSISLKYYWLLLTLIYKENVKSLISIRKIINPSRKEDDEPDHFH